jgi:hypothetical protein
MWVGTHTKLEVLETETERERDRERERGLDLDDPREIQIANGYLCWNRICDVNELQPNINTLFWKQRKTENETELCFREIQIQIAERERDLVAWTESGRGATLRGRGPWRSLVPLFYFLFFFYFLNLFIFWPVLSHTIYLFWQDIRWAWPGPYCESWVISTAFGRRA